MTDGVTKVTVRKNAYGEYTVRIYRGTRYNEDETYYALDKQDALDTKRVIERQYGLIGTKRIENPYGRKAKGGSYTRAYYGRARLSKPKSYREIFVIFGAGVEWV